MRDLIESAARRANVRLLLVVDQFEEFIILGEPDLQARFTTLIEQLRAASIPKLQILLTLRSDYQSMLPDLGLPPLHYGENFYQISRFTLAAANKFMAESDLGLQQELLKRLINSAADMDETPGLVRPITLNVLGYCTWRQAKAARNLWMPVGSSVSISSRSWARRGFAIARRWYWN